MTLTLSKCARCGQLFARIRSAVCPECQDDEERDYVRIREVLQTSSEVTAEQVAEAAGVSLRCVLRLMEEGRIGSMAPGTAIPCGRCGEPAISMSKKLCERCLIELDHEFAKAVRTLRGTRRPRPSSSVNNIRESLGKKRRRTAPTPPGKIKPGA